MLVNEKELKVHFDGDEELIGELIEIFESSYPNKLIEVKEALSSKDYGKLELHAHTLKGMIVNFFSKDLKEAAFYLEKMGRDKRDEDGSKYLEILEAGLPVLITEVKSLI